jgi:hypothetical protein
MADPTPTPPNPEPTSNPEPAQTEEAFWKKLDERVKANLDSFYKDKLKDFQKNSSSRTGQGRTTLPGIIANIMFGPEKKD